MSLPLIGVAGLYLALVLVAQLYFKRAANAIPNEGAQAAFLNLLTNGHMWIALIAYGIAMLSWIWLLKHVDLSRIFPIMSALLLLTIPLISAYFLQESLSARYWLGVIFMICGIALIATEIKPL